MGACSVTGCERPSQSRMLCGKHHKRWLRHGDPLIGEAKGTAPACAVSGCGRPVTERGWCHGHYQRWHRTGDVHADEPLPRRKQPQTCVVDGCHRSTQARGLCGTHYKRKVKHGEVLPSVAVRVTTGEGWLSHGYWNVPVPVELQHLTNGDNQVGEHWLVMAQHLDRPLYPDEVVHHRNGVRTDNRLENLELWSTAHPKGQRIEEKVEFALAVLVRYRPELLSDLNGHVGNM